MNKLTMLDYVKETPDVLKTNIEQYTTLVDPLMKEVQQKEIKRILLVASGSSYNACYCARSFVEKVSSLEVRIITPYTFTYYENNIKENDLVLVLTQSGLSTNAIEALKIIKKKECRAICLTGNKNSDVKDVADIVIEYGVGEELVGYVTKGVSSLALFLDLFAIAYSGKTEYLDELKKAADLNEEMIDQATNFIQQHYKNFSSMSWVYSCGAGANYGTALESALKMGETIHIPSCCYEIEEYIHGPNLQLTPQYNVIFFDGNDGASRRVEQVYKATRKVTNRVYLISNNPQLSSDEHVLSLSDTVSSELSPLVYLPFVQLLSFIVSNDLHSIYQHPLLKEFKAIAAAKTENFVNYDGDD